jgi:N6-adenosine-specific RNA methylase IME4
MDFHPIANIFPMLPDAELETLAADIKANGLHHPITTYEGKVLDGRNRYAACTIACVEPLFIEYEGDDPVGFVISENIVRRHLDETQRGLCAARLANMREGRPETGSNDLVSQDRAAKLMNVSVPTLKRAKCVLDNGIPELVKCADAGKVTVGAASKIVKLPNDRQAAITDKISSGIKPQEAMRQVLAESYDGPQLTEMPQGKKYRVIYADPPWDYGNTQPDYHPEQRDHYKTMSLDEICDMPIVDLTTDDAVLFLWATSPILREAFDVINAWGFEYKASFVWDKVKHNMGHYNSVRHEFLLICVRGSCQPDVRKLFDSVVTEERTEHSKKPDTFRKMIEELYTHGNKIELFARQEFDGWDYYGNEIIS